MSIEFLTLESSQTVPCALYVKLKPKLGEDICVCLALSHFTKFNFIILSLWRVLGGWWE